MRLVRGWFTQARNISQRGVQSSGPRGPEDSHAANENQVLSLMDDGSHPYYPGTPWVELELGPTLEKASKPRHSSFLPKRLRVFRRKARLNVSRANSCLGPSWPESLPYFGSLQITHHEPADL